MNESGIERWHFSQYANGELIKHEVLTDYDYARMQIRRRGLLSGTNVLTRSSKCECRGRLS